MQTETLAIELHTQGGSAPEWVHLVPAGTFHGVDGRGPFTLVDPGAVIAASKTPLSIDYNHSTHLLTAAGNPTPAAGWIEEMEARQDGIWGRVEWTPNGRKAVAWKEYRFVSPAFASKDGKVSQIVNAAITNKPNLKELVQLNSEQSKGAVSDAALVGLPEDASPRAIAGAAAERLRDAVGTLSILRGLFGIAGDGSNSDLIDAAEAAIAAMVELPEDAGPSAVAGAAAERLRDAISTLSIMRGIFGVAEEGSNAALIAAANVAANAATTSLHTADPSRFVPIETFQHLMVQYNKLNSGIPEQQAKLAVEQAIKEGRIMSFMRDWAINLCTQNKASFDDFLEGAGRPIHTFTQMIKTPMHERPHAEAFRRNARSDRAQALGADSSPILTNMGVSKEDAAKYGVK